MANEATIRNFRKAYLLAFTKDKSLSTAEKGKIEAKKRGRPLLFGEYRFVSVKAPWDIKRNAQHTLLSHPPILDNIPLGYYPKWGGGQ